MHFRTTPAPGDAIWGTMVALLSVRQMMGTGPSAVARRARLIHNPHSRSFMRRLPVLLATPVVLAGMVFTVAAVKPPAPKAQKSHKAKANDFGNADAITQEELKDYDYFLASDQLQGRNLPSRGYDIAAL